MDEHLITHYFSHLSVIQKSWRIYFPPLEHLQGGSDQLEKLIKGF
jgi:hypothetical protein